MNWVKAASAARAGCAAPGVIAASIRTAAINLCRKPESCRLKRRPSMRDGLFGMFGGNIRQFVDIGNADRRQNENRVNDGLPHHAGFSVAALARGQSSGLDEGAQQMDR